MNPPPDEDSSAGFHELRAAGRISPTLCLTPEAVGLPARPLLHALLTHLPLAVIAVDGSGRVRIWNGAAERLLGWSSREVLGQPPPLALPVCRAGENPGDAVIPPALSLARLTRKDGEPAEVRVSVTPLREQGDGPLTWLFFLEDVGEIRQLEKALAQAQGRSVVGKLTFGVAHDFNNLLTVICGFSELLQMELAPDCPQRGLAAQILQAASDATSVTRQLLAFNRPQESRPTSVDVAALVRSRVKLLRRLLNEDSELEVELASDLWTAQADPLFLDQFLFGLIIREVPGRKILVQAANGAEADQVCLSIHEMGSRLVPMVASELEGLMRLATKHGGDLRVQASENGRRISSLLLPRHLSNAEVAVSAQQKRSRKRETILVADDSIELRQFVSLVLRTHGYEVLEAGDGGELSLLGERYQDRLDLVLSDMIMPGESTTTIFRRLQQHRPNLRMLCMTGYTREAVARRGLNWLPLLEKPFTQRGLLDRVRATLDGPIPQAPRES